MKSFRLGTRKSPLAMAQAGWVADRIRQGGVEVELAGIVTEGDRAKTQKTGGKGIFVKAIDEALLKKKIDLAVHSAKDVPAELTKGLVMAAIPVREDVADVLVSAKGWSLSSLPQGAKVGTSSLRRAAQLRFFRPDIHVIPVRGNVETRLAKIGGCDAILLAAAGIHRLGGIDKIVERGRAGPCGLKISRLDPSEFLPAPGQGALMVVCRKEDRSKFSDLSDPATLAALEMERALVTYLGADCSWPLGVLVKQGSDGMCSMTAAIFSLEGKLRVHEGLTGAKSVETAKKLAAKLLKKGGSKILEWNRRIQEEGRLDVKS